jgi:hypothetical protein
LSEAEADLRMKLKEAEKKHSELDQELTISRLNCKMYQDSARDAEASNKSLESRLSTVLTQKDGLQTRFNEAIQQNIFLGITKPDASRITVFTEEEKNRLRTRSDKRQEAASTVEYQIKLQLLGRAFADLLTESFVRGGAGVDFGTFIDTWEPKQRRESYEARLKKSGISHLADYIPWADTFNTARDAFDSTRSASASAAGPTCPAQEVADETDSETHSDGGIALGE